MTTSPRCLVGTGHQQTSSAWANALEELGFTVTLALDGANVWRRFHSECFDLVVLDDELPQFRGLGLLWTYRNMGSDAPVVFLGPEDAHREARVAGAQVCLCKPLDADVVLQAMVRLGLARPRLVKSA